MEIVKKDGIKTLFKLDASDIESAIRQFICTCHPEYNEGYTIDPIMENKDILVKCEYQAKNKDNG